MMLALKTKAYRAPLMILAVVSACGAPRSDKSRLTHDLHSPTLESKSFLWTEINDKLFESLVVPMQQEADPRSQVQFMDQSHPLVKKAQQYVDLFDNNLRAKYPDRLAVVPKPQVRVRLSNVPNAFVMEMPVCYDAKVIIDPTVKESRATKLQAIALSPDGRVTPPIYSQCATKSDAKELEAYVAWYNKNSTCQLKSTRDKNNKVVISIGDSCSVSGYFQGASSAATLIVTTTANIITVNSAMIAIQTETQFASVLAHELGHYYHAHTSLNQNHDFNYFYQLTDDNSDHKPVADEGMRELGENLKKLRVPQSQYQKVDGQKWRSELFMPMMAIGKILSQHQKCVKGQEDSCNWKCDELGALIADKSFANAIGNFPLEKLSPEGKKTYDKFVESFEACIEPVKVSTGFFAKADGFTLPLRAFGQALSLDQNLAPIFDSVRPAGSVVETMNALNKAVEAYDKNVVERLKSIEDMHVGYYTIEQEADELGVEFMADVGLNPRDAIASYLALGDFIQAEKEASGMPLLVGEVSSKECDALNADNWLDASGKPAWVSIADFQDIHHTTCYRAFNLNREIKVHGYTVKANGPAQKIVGTASDWESIKKDTVEAQKQASKPVRRSFWDVIFGRNTAIDDLHLNVFNANRNSCGYGSY